jgi:hypothetical protein
MTSSSDREDMTSLVQKSDLEPLGEDIAQLFVNISVIASWE